MTTGTLTGVALGPGDPDLITVKGLKILQNADLIFYPETTATHSFSLGILKQLNVKTPAIPLYIPMSGKQREQIYQKAFAKIKVEIYKGKNIAIISEGDLLFYSTFGYLLKLARADKIKCNIVPGIPAFIAAGALAKRSIVEGNTGLKVIAKPHNFDEIKNAIKQNTTVVIMKMNFLTRWDEFLKNTQSNFLYAERVGTKEQFFTSDANELEQRKIPYFSLLIIYNK
jgi:precorrin-2/cobalt-factor-2 C20-methyltransferase